MKLFDKKVFEVCEILKFNSIKNLKKIYHSFLAKTFSKNYTIKHKIIFEAVKKLLNLND